VVLGRRVLEIRVLGAIAGALLLAGAMVGCGSGVGEENADGRGGERGSAATDGETTAPEGGRPASGAAGEPAGLDVEVVTPGGAYLPAVFGEGSLWATDPATCNDTMSVSGSASSSGGASFPSTIIMESSAQAMCVPPDETLLKRLDPRTGEEVAAIPLEGFFDEARGQVAVGAGSVWAVGASEDSDLVLRVDPETNRVADRIPLDSPPTSLAFGHGSVWVTSSGRGTLSRIDPRTGEVTAEIEVGRGAADVAADGGSGDVWVACWGGTEPEHNQLSRVDPEADRVVAQIPIVEHARYGGPQGVAVGEGAVWAQGARGGLFKVDPATNEVVAERDLGGDSTSDLAVYGGSVWTVAQVSVGTRLYRVDPRTARVVASEHGPDPSEGGYGGLVAGGGYVWFESGDGLARVAP
jgi:DNA-binding beta-propeller fold protein YncE